MQKDNRLYQLAENVLKNSVKLKKGEKIYIEAFGPAVLDLMEIFIQKATELGGVPFYFYNDEHLLKAVIDNASEEQMKAFGETGSSFDTGAPDPLVCDALSQSGHGSVGKNVGGGV